eukprot:scaffold40062_cov176-Amphora_coffeaeformis.AAC.1
MDNFLGPLSCSIVDEICVEFEFHPSVVPRTAGAVSFHPLSRDQWRQRTLDDPLGGIKTLVDVNRFNIGSHGGGED